jgi:hypothetical protein
MAANVYNITLPDGTTIPLPAWATDETLRRLVAETSASKKLDEKLLKVLSGIVHETGSIDDILRDLKSATQREAKKREILDKSTQRSVGRFTTAATKAAKGMGDTSKPLSSSLDMMKGAVQTLFKDMSSSSSVAGKSMSKYSTKTLRTFGAFAKASGIAVTTILGMNAKKFEQYEQSQRRMIDAGAAFLESEQSFHDLYKKAITAGVSYDTFTQLVQQSGTTLLALGDSVSSGQVKFLSIFKDVNDSADKFGDFGLKSADMMQEFADYVELQRLKGTVGGLGDESQKKLRDGFANLMFETIALANLTGIKSKSQREAMRNASKDPLYILGVGSMTDDQQRSMSNATKLYGSQRDSSTMAKILDDIKAAIGRHRGNVDNAWVEVQTQIYGGDAGAQAIMSMMASTGVINRLRTAHDSGQEITPIFNDVLAALSDTSNPIWNNVSGVGVGGKMLEFAADADQLYKIVGKANAEKLADIKTDGFDTTNASGIGQQLEASGSIVSTMNTFGIMMAELEEKVLLPLDKTAQSLYSISSAFRMFVDVALSSTIKSRFEDYKIPLTASNTQVMAQLDRIIMINKRGFNKSDVSVSKGKDGKWKAAANDDAKKSQDTYAELMKKQRENKPLTKREQARLRDHDDANLMKDNMQETIKINAEMKNKANEDVPTLDQMKKEGKNFGTDQKSSVTPNVTNTQTAHVKLITDHQSTTLQNHKSMLSLTEELKTTVANMKQLVTDRSNSTRTA